MGVLSMYFGWGRHLLYRKLGVEKVILFRGEKKYGKFIISYLDSYGYNFVWGHRLIYG